MIKYEVFSDKGDRSINEDSVEVGRRNDDYCFILADGLGGHGSGDLASASVVKTIKDYFQANGSVTDECLTECIKLAQQRLMEAQKRLDKDSEMKTTVVVLMLNEEKAIWAHIGDSRLYYIKKKKDWKRTLDHSVPQMLVTMGEIREDQIRGHADRNRLVRVLGVEWDDDTVDVSGRETMEEKDAMLLCSDGFWELIDEKTMVKALKHSNDPEEWVSRMVEVVREHGVGKDMDNFSAIAVMNVPVKKHKF